MDDDAGGADAAAVFDDIESMPAAPPRNKAGPALFAFESGFFTLFVGCATGAWIGVV